MVTRIIYRPEQYLVTIHTMNLFLYSLNIVNYQIIYFIIEY